MNESGIRDDPEVSDVSDGENNGLIINRKGRKIYRGKFSRKF